MRKPGFILVCILALCPMTSHAVLVGWLKDDVKALMPYEEFPTVEDAYRLIPDDDPLAEIKRSEALYLLIDLLSFYPIHQPGKWQDLEKTYKQAFRKNGWRWPLRKDEKMLLKNDGFDVYHLVMKTYFPEALKLKQSADGSHKQDAFIKMLAVIVAGLVVLIIFAIASRKFKRD